MIILYRNIIYSLLFTTSVIAAQEFSCGVEKVYYADKLYNTIMIEDQCWLRENLDVGIQLNTSKSSSNNYLIEKYCYNNDSSFCKKYGGLYTWSEAMFYSTDEGTRGICPEGWHIPTLNEFEIFRKSVNNEGNSIKERGYGSGWGVGTNTTGFSALFAGIREPNRDFSREGMNTNYWSSSRESPTNPYYLGINSLMNDIFISLISYRYSYSVRCLKDN